MQAKELHRIIEEHVTACRDNALAANALTATAYTNNRARAEAFDEVMRFLKTIQLVCEDDA